MASLENYCTFAANQNENKMIYTKPQTKENTNTWCVFDYNTGIVLVANLTWVDVCQYAANKGYACREYDRQNDEIIFY